LNSEFVVGADASDSTAFIALVLGFRADVAQLHQRVCENCNLPRIHMRRIHRRRMVVDTVNRFPTDSVHMYCFEVSRHKHVEALDANPKTRFMSSTHKNNNIDYCIVMEMKSAISSSLDSFGRSWNDVAVECDDDTKKMFKMAGRTVNPQEKAYELADVVAWANHAKSHMKQVRGVDITSKIDGRLRKKLSF
jgi:hypothetical protein